MERTDNDDKGKRGEQSEEKDVRVRGEGEIGERKREIRG